MGDSLIDAVREERKRVSSDARAADRPASERFARLGGALAGMARDLTDARQEVRRLRRENALLRRQVHELVHRR